MISNPVSNLQVWVISRADGCLLLSGSDKVAAFPDEVSSVSAALRLASEAKREGRGCTVTLCDRHDSWHEISLLAA